MTQNSIDKLAKIQELCKEGQEKGTDDALEETLSLLLSLLGFFGVAQTKDEYLDNFMEVNQILQYVSKNLDLFHRDIAVILCFLSPVKNYYKVSGLLTYYPVLYQKVKDHFLTFEEETPERVDSLLRGLDP